MCTFVSRAIMGLQKKTIKSKKKKLYSFVRVPCSVVTLQFFVRKRFFFTLGSADVQFLVSRLTL